MKKAFVILAAVCLLPAAALAGTLTLAWEHDGDGVTGYRVYQNGTDVAEVTEKTWTTADLTHGQDYCWQVTAYNDQAESLPSNKLCVTYTDQVVINLPSSPQRLILEFGK